MSEVVLKDDKGEIMPKGQVILCSECEPAPMAFDDFES